MNKIKDPRNSVRSAEIVNFASKYLFPLLLFLTGSYFLHSPLFKDNMGYIHGDLGDARLISVFLEHSYRYLFSQDPNLSYWSPSWIYFPAKNGLAYSDVMSGAIPLYAPWRLIGLSEINSYQLWFVSTSAANFLSFLLIAYFLGFSPLAAATGSYIVSFSLSNISYANHPQMLSQYYLLLTAYFILRLFKAEALKVRVKFAIYAGIMYSLQMWLAFYPLWFFTFLLGLCSLFMMIRHMKYLRLHWKTYIWPAFAFIVTVSLLVYPILRRYLIVKDLMGPRQWAEISVFLPTWQTYLLPTAESVFYRSLLFDKFSPLFLRHSELCMFSGFVVLAAPILFLLTRRVDKVDSKWASLMSGILFGLLTLMILTLRWGVDVSSFSLWQMVIERVPGANAIRAVGRVSLTLQLFSALLLSYSLTVIQGRFKQGWIISMALAISVLMENAVVHRYVFPVAMSEDRIAALAAEIEASGKNCSVFHRSFQPDSFPFREVDSMILSQRSGIATSNGYSGGMPPTYWDSDTFRSQSIDKVQEWFSMNNRPISKDELCFLP